MSKGRAFPFFGFALALLGTAAASAEEQPSRFEVSQSLVELPRVRVVLDAVNEEGGTWQVRAEDLEASLGGTALRFEQVTPFTETLGGISFVILVDVSKPLPGGGLDAVKEQLHAWIENVRPIDRAAVVAFSDEVVTRQDFTSDRKALAEAVDGLEPLGTPAALFEGIRASVDALESNASELPFRKVVVLLSDGRDDGDDISESEILEHVERLHFPIHTIGYSNIPGAQREEYLDLLRRISERSGGSYVASEEDDFGSVYTRLRETVTRVTMLTLACDDCDPETSPQALEVSWGRDDLSLSASQEAGVTGPTGWRRWVYGRPVAPIAVGVALIGLILLLPRLRGRSAAPAEPRSEGVDEIEDLHSGEQPIVEDPPTHEPGDADAVTQALDDPQNLHPGAAPTRRAEPPRHHGIAIQLHALAGAPLSTARIDLAETAICGRHSECDLAVDDDEVSKQHLAFLRHENKVLVEDLGSTNGTMVNGIRLQGRMVIQTGDRILLGRTEFRVSIGS